MKNLAIFFVLMLVSICASAETRKKIVVFDTQINKAQYDASYMCHIGSSVGSVSVVEGVKSYLDKPKLTIYDEHGQDIVESISSRMDKSKYCIYHIVYTTSEHSKEVDYIKALNVASSLVNVAGVNMSLSSPNDPKNYLTIEFTVIQKWLNQGVKVIVAAGNDRLLLTEHRCFVYPTCLKLKLKKNENFFVVGNSTFETDPNSRYKLTTNLTQDFPMVFEDGKSEYFQNLSGTSQATAHFTGKMFSK